MSNDVPIIETERLLLRGHRLDDFPECVAMWADPGVYRFITGTPSTEQQTWMRMLSYRGHWALMGYGYWAVEERSSHRFVGELGFADFKRDIEPSLRASPEVGWALAPHVQGRGYAIEAIGAALNWGEANLHQPRMVCIINSDNVRSIQLSRKFGFSLLRQTSYRGADVVVFARDRA